MVFLELRSVSKSYGLTQVLDSIDLCVKRHEVVCLIGSSGSGKSTLLRCINALESIDAGRIILDGQLASGKSVNVNVLRTRVGMVFQHYNLFDNLSVLRNVTLGPIRVLGVKKAVAEAEARVLLERVGMSDQADKYPRQLSGGQQQRVAIVRSLAMRPDVLLLDEVTSALDPELVDEVLDLVRSLARDGMTMVLATHEMGFARQSADRICFLREGQVLEEGPPSEIFSNPKHPATRAFLRRTLADDGAS